MRPESMLVGELFPELTHQLLRDLRRLKRTDLSEQIVSLRVIDRCRCGSDTCGTFYTQDAEFRKRSARSRADLMLPCGANLFESGGTVVEIETLDPRVQAVLRRVIP